MAYSNSFRVPLIFDDIEAIRDNESIRAVWPLTMPLNPPRQTTVAGRPIVNLSLALNFAISGVDVWSYHVVNLLIHLICAVLLAAIVRRTLSLPQFATRLRDSAAPIAAAIALIWAVHPLHTMCVTYIIQRAESLMAFFYLLTLYCVIRAVHSPRPGSWMSVAILACALGMGCKETMVTAPVVVWLYDRFFLADSSTRFRRLRAWLYAGLTSTWAILIYLNLTAPRSDSAGLTLQGIPPLAYLRAQPGVILHYLRLAFWPSGLCLDYHWPIALTTWQVLAPAAFVLALLALTIWGIAERRPPAFAGAWFFLILAPTSTFVPIVIVASEHRMYLPLAALVSLCVIAIWPWLGAKGGHAANRVVGPVLVLLIVSTLGVVTYRRNMDYQSLESIWRDVVEKRPDNPRGRNNLGTALQSAGKVSVAITQFHEALRILPDYGEAHYNLGVALGATGRLGEATDHFRQALTGPRRDGRAFYNLGYALQLQGRFTEAIPHFEEALARQPSHLKAMNSLAVCLAVSGRPREAALLLRESLKIERDSPVALNALAWILATHPDESLRDGRDALGLASRAIELMKRQDAGGLDTLAAAYAEVGRFDDALTTANEALILAETAKQPELARSITERIKLYRERKPFRDLAGGPGGQPAATSKPDPKR